MNKWTQNRSPKYAKTGLEQGLFCNCYKVFGTKQIFGKIIGPKVFCFYHISVAADFGLNP